MDLHLSETILSLSVTVELLTLEDLDKLKKSQVFSAFFSEAKEGLFAAFGQEHLAKSQAMTQPSVEQNRFLIILLITLSFPQVSWMFFGLNCFQGHSVKFFCSLFCILNMQIKCKFSSISRAGLI